MKPFRPFVAVLVILYAVAGAAGTGRADDRQPDGKSPPSAQPAASAQDELVAKADEVAAKVAKLRGLAVRHPIKRGVMNKQQITARLLKRVRQEYSAEEISGEALALKRFGLIPADVDYLEMVITLMREQVAGFYDPWEKQLYIADWTSFGGDMLMAHEIDHALQDQHFDLKKFMKPDRSNSDRVVARQALVEGDGTALMLEFTMAEVGQTAPWGQPGFADGLGASMASQLGSFGDVPLVLKEGLVFPYMGGLTFIAHFRARHPWKRIDAMYKKPPLSTEQVIHPEKYETYEAPITVSGVRPPALSKYKIAHDTVNGEKGLELLLREHDVSRERAELAAAGWGGDRLMVLTPPGHKGGVRGSIGIQHTVWDHEADAVEFFDAAADALGELTGDKRAMRSATLVEYRLASGALASLERRGDMVVMLVGTPPAQSESVRQQVWGWTVTRP